MYIITTDKVIFNIKFEKIVKSDIYVSTAYMLPIVLDINILIILIFVFKIVPVANNITVFINIFSRKIISK